MFNLVSAYENCGIAFLVSKRPFDNVFSSGGSFPMLGFAGAAYCPRRFSPPRWDRRRLTTLFSLVGLGIALVLAALFEGDGAGMMVESTTVSFFSSSLFAGRSSATWANNFFCSPLCTKSFQNLPGGGQTPKNLIFNQKNEEGVKCANMIRNLNKEQSCCSIRLVWSRRQQGVHAICEVLRFSKCGYCRSFRIPELPRPW